MQKFISKISIAMLAITMLATSVVFAPFSPIKQALGATIPTPVASFSTSLATSMTASDTSMSLVSITTDDAVTLTNGTVYGFVIDEGTSSEEYVVGTINTTSLSVTSMTRGISVITGNTSITALQKAHRRGSSVKITDHPVLTVMSRIMNGNETFPNTISYASGVTPVSGSDLADREYVLSVVTGGAVSYEKVIITGTAGESLSAGNYVYLNTSDGRWYKTDADASATSEGVTLGIAQGSGTTGNSISSGVLIRGIDTNQSGLTANTKYYLSGTAGTASTSAGTKEVTIGFSLSTTSILFVPYFDQVITEDELDAIVGTTGIPSATNKFVTSDNLSESTTDQTQTTQNSSVEFGEADVTTKKNLIAQSFVTGNTKMRSVSFYKSADTGTFTGSVTIALQADSSGSPSGSNLASKTFTNGQWSGLSSGENIATFSSEYGSMTVGSTYWIVGSASTSDSSNHPNFGTNTAGGYSSGSLKYKNSTDGWVAVSTTDMYFKTWEGNASQVIKTNSSGVIDSDFFSTSEMPLAAFTQEAAPDTNDSLAATPEWTAGSNASGSVIYLRIQGGASLYRFERDSLTGAYLLTHSVSPTVTVPSSDEGSIIVIGDYIYLFTNDGTNIISRRFLASDLTGETTMTVPTVAATQHVGAWTDGTNAYVVSANSDTTSRKWSLSGTTFTAVSTATVTTNIFAQNSESCMFDGSTAYCSRSTGSNHTIEKLTTIDGSTRSTSTKKIGNTFSDLMIGSFIVNIDTYRMYIGYLYAFYDETSQVSPHLRLIPVTKP